MMAIGVVPLAGRAYRATRAPGGKPDLNGIWQAGEVGSQLGSTIFVIGVYREFIHIVSGKGCSRQL